LSGGTRDKMQEVIQAGVCSRLDEWLLCGRGKGQGQGRLPQTTGPAARVGRGACCEECG